MMYVEQIVENKYKANSYILINDDDCVVIDINPRTIPFILSKNLKPHFLFITHEHFDHIQGMSELKELFPMVKIIASKTASDLMISSKGNLSFFVDGKGFDERHADIYIEEQSEYTFKEKTIKTYYTPGHTSGCIIVNIENILFTGDTVLDIKTPTIYPNSSKKQLIESIEFIDNFFNDDTIFYQGHGKPFIKSQWDKALSLPKKKNKI